MQEHPIPQDVTGYRFHIVGNMTLKQFAQMGIGVVIAVVIYNTNLLTIIKWPLIALAVGLGGMMAFVPIEERPLDHWITTFFKRLYNPTKFYWKREAHVPFALKTKRDKPTPAATDFEIDLSPARRKRIEDYIKSVQQPSQKEDWEMLEGNRISQILDTFGEVQVDSVDSRPQKIKPQLATRVRKLPADSPRPATNQAIVFESPTTTVKPVQEARQINSEAKSQAKPIQPPLKSANHRGNTLKPPVEIFADEEIAIKPA